MYDLEVELGVEWMVREKRKLPCWAAGGEIYQRLIAARFGQNGGEGKQQQLGHR